MDTSNLYLDFDAFLRSFKQNNDSSFAFLLGAGASITSGIQSANECIWDWKNLLYSTSQTNQKNLIDPKRSDISKSIIQNWLDSQGGYPMLNSPEEYAFYAEKAYPIEGDRVKYFQQLAHNKVPYIGYKLLCLLNKYSIVKSIWSTNFDGLVERAAQQSNITPICINLDCTERIYRTESSNELLYVALHGDYKYSSLKNTSKELDSQHSNFVAALKRYFIDKNLVVIGYSGRDKSLMSALSQTFTEKGAGRLYWCGLGENIAPEVQQLLVDARNAGRYAFYINTDGFDKTILSLVSFCFNEEIEKQKEVNEILKVIPQEEENIVPFQINKEKTYKYLKSNLFPVIFPKEIFQFDVVFESNKSQWEYLREKINGHDIIAVPYRQKVYAISTISEINNSFNGLIKGEIERIPISIDDIERNGLFKELFLNAVLYGLSKGRKLGVNYRRNLLWKNEILKNDNGTILHEALECGLVFIPKKEYALLSIIPTVYIDPDAVISKEKKQEYSRTYLDKMWNLAYDQKLAMWETIIYNDARYNFDIPLNSHSGFNFSISKNRGYVEVQNYEYQMKIYPPREYDSKKTIYNGILLKEPELEFVNAYVDRPFLDPNPMRGLSNHKPYDSWQNNVFPKDVHLGVICPLSYSNTFCTFLNRLNTTITTNKQSDYIQEYTGFNSIYKCRLDIPNTGSDKWITIKDDPQSAINLVKTICHNANVLAERYPGVVTTIFIPKSWSNFRQFKHDGESFDLHNYVKAYAAQHGFTTQFIEEDTLYDKMICEISWWLSLAMFVKSLRIPWALANLDPDTAYAGIGYSIKKNKDGYTDIVLGCSHIYNAKGQGLRYKLSKVDHPKFDRKRNPYLNFEEAYKFGITIRELFEKSIEKLPKRVVIHKRTPFKQEEIDGITNALGQAGITNIDLITINYEYNMKFISQIVYQGKMSTETFPIHRGTCIKLSSRNALLWTHGVVPSIRGGSYKYYPGGRCIPSPLKITKYFGKGDLQTIATEILGFTKMNWNSFNLYTKLPATIDTSNTLAQVGNLLHQYNGITYDYRYFI